VGHHDAAPHGNTGEPATPSAQEAPSALLGTARRRVVAAPGRVWLPAAPLAAAVRAAGGVGALLKGRRRTREGERLARAYYRALQRGWITVATGDELACKLLRVHPSAVWGQRFWADAA
jgi:hypothetical protein